MFKKDFDIKGDKIYNIIKDICIISILIFILVKSTLTEKNLSTKMNTIETNVQTNTIKSEINKTSSDEANKSQNNSNSTSGQNGQNSQNDNRAVEPMKIKVVTQPQIIREKTNNYYPVYKFIEKINEKTTEKTNEKIIYKTNDAKEVDLTEVNSRLNRLEEDVKELLKRKYQYDPEEKALLIKIYEKLNKLGTTQPVNDKVNTTQAKNTKDDVDYTNYIISEVVKQVNQNRIIGEIRNMDTEKSGTEKMGMGKKEKSIPEEKKSFPDMTTNKNVEDESVPITKVDSPSTKEQSKDTTFEKIEPMLSKTNQEMMPPALFFPSDKFSTDNNYVVFEWDNVPNAKEYELYINDKQVYKGQRNKYVFASTFKEGKNKWYVVAKNETTSAKSTIYEFNKKEKEEFHWSVGGKFNMNLIGASGGYSNYNLGYGFGVSFDFEFLRTKMFEVPFLLSMEADLQYNLYAFKYKNVDNPLVKVDYFYLPISAKPTWKFGDFSVFAIAGIYTGFLLSSNIELGNGSKVNFEEYINPIDFGFSFGAGVGYRFFNFLDVSFDVRYNIGVSKAFRRSDYSPSIGSNGVTFTLKVGAYF